MSRKLKGIRRKGKGWSAYVRVNGKLHTKQFPPMTTTKEMRRWREDQIAAGFPVITAEAARRERIQQELRRYRRAWWIYFLQGDAYIKIGRTSNVPARVKALQAASPIPLTLLARIREGGATMTETALHRRFAHLRVNGEWFQLGPELQEFIQTCPDQ